MGLFRKTEKSRKELLEEIKEECYAMTFGAGIPEVFMEYEDAKNASDKELKRIAKSFGISLYK